MKIWRLDTMDSFPKIGMKCEQVRSRLKKLSIAKDPSVQASLINQARLHEGDGIVSELAKEFGDTNNHSSNRLGYNSRYSENYDKIFKGSE